MVPKKINPPPALPKKFGLLLPVMLQGRERERERRKKKTSERQKEQRLKDRVTCERGQETVK